MNVWLLTSGDYSDYRVEGVYSSKKNAEEAWSEISRAYKYLNHVEIVEWEMDTGVDGIFFWWVTYEPDRNFWYAHYHPMPDVEHPVNQVHGWIYCGKQHYGVTVRARNEEGAKKIGMEMILQSIAKGNNNV